MIGYGLALRRVAVWVVLGALPVALLLAFLMTAALPSDRPATQAVDLHTAWVGGASYVHGNSPYPASTADFVPSGPAQSFVQTPAVAATFAAVSLVPYGVVAACVPSLLAGAIILALWLLDVRDWRCFGATFLSPAVLTSISVGTLTPLLLLSAAAAWRWRKSLPVTALATAGAIAAKLLMWPLVVWLWLSGRRRAACAATLAAVLLLGIAFAPLGVNVAREYPHLLRRDSGVVGPLSYSLLSLDRGSGDVGATVLEVSSGLLVIATLLAGQRLQWDDRRVFAAAILASIALSPIVHLHYLTLLVAALGVMRPGFGILWLLPVVLWLTPRQNAEVSLWRTGLVFAVLTTVAATTCVGRRAQTPLVLRRHVRSS